MAERSQRSKSNLALENFFVGWAFSFYFFSSLINHEQMPTISLRAMFENIKIKLCGYKFALKINLNSQKTY